MNTSNMKQYNELLWLGVKKSKRDSVRGSKSTMYCDPAHVCMIQLCTPDCLDITKFDSYIGDSEAVFKVPDLYTHEQQTVVLPTEYLRRILDNVTSDSIRLKVSDDMPIELQWCVGEDSWWAVIAPRIENE